MAYEETQPPAVLKQRLRLFTTTRFDSLLLLLNSESIDTYSGQLQKCQLADVDFISLKNDDLMLTPPEILTKYMLRANAKDAWLFVAVVHDVLEKSYPAKAFLHADKMDVLCLDPNSGRWDLPPPEWFSFDLRAKVFELEEDNIYLRERDRVRTRRLYQSDTQLKLLWKELDGMEQIASNLQYLLGETREERNRFAKTLYQQVERNNQMGARLHSYEIFVREFIELRNEKFPELLKDITSVTQNISAIYKEMQLFFTEMQDMSTQDIENFEQRVKDKFEAVNKTIESSIKETLTTTIEKFKELKAGDKELAETKPSGSPEQPA